MIFLKKYSLRKSTQLQGTWVVVNLDHGNDLVESGDLGRCFKKCLALKEFDKITKSVKTPKTRKVNLKVFLVIEDENTITECVEVSKTWLKPIKEWKPTNIATSNEYISMALWRKDASDEFLGVREFEVDDFQFSQLENMFKKSNMVLDEVVL